MEDVRTFQEHVQSNGLIGLHNCTGETITFTSVRFLRPRTLVSTKKRAKKTIKITFVFFKEKIWEQTLSPV